MACHKALSAVACSFEFTNNANEDLYLLKRNTPLEGLYSEFISVSLDDRPLEYQGILMHRIPPTKDEFILLKGGESISISVQITDIFIIDTDGLYTVQYSRPLQYLPVSAMSIDQLRVSFVHESVQLDLEDTSVLSKPTIEEVKIDYTVHLEACGSASFSNGNRNNSQTLDAHKKLCSGCDRGQVMVGNNFTISKTWFGAPDHGRIFIARKVYSDVKSGIVNNVVTYYNNGPDCKDTTYAYVTKSVNHTVYLCNLYYESQALCSKTDESKEGTLLHEWAHSYGGRVDYSSGGTNYYGRSKCKELAKNDPDNAVRNADNYCYHYCDAQK